MTIYPDVLVVPLCFMTGVSVLHMISSHNTYLIIMISLILSFLMSLGFKWRRTNKMQSEKHMMHHILSIVDILISSAISFVLIFVFYNKIVEITDIYTDHTPAHLKITVLILYFGGIVIIAIGTPIVSMHVMSILFSRVIGSKSISATDIDDSK